MSWRKLAAAGISWQRVCRTPARRLRAWPQRSARNTVSVTIQRTKRAMESFELFASRSRACRASRRCAREKDTLTRRVSGFSDTRNQAYFPFSISNFSFVKLTGATVKLVFAPAERDVYSRQRLRKFLASLGARPGSGTNTQAVKAVALLRSLGVKKGPLA